MTIEITTYGEILEGIHERVLKGIELLNEHGPNLDGPWFMRLDLDTLDIQSCSRCVVGQLCVSYLDGLYELETNSRTEIWGPDYGFCPLYAESPMLTETWKEEITKLRENHVH
jgi:hypothetical protein